MADFEGENLNFDELKMPGEENAAVDPVLEDEAVEQLEAEEMPADDQVAVAEKSEEEEPKKKSGKKSLLVEAVAAIGLPVVCAGLFLANIIYLSSAIYLLGLCYVPLGMWMGRRSNTLYSVLVGGALVAVMTASFYLWIELRKHDFDIKAKGSRVSMIQPIGTESLAWHNLPMNQLDA